MPAPARMPGPPPGLAGAERRCRVLGEANVRKDEALAVLGEGSGASFERAKRAFRRQAMKWHPDRNPAPEAEERFKRARGAFEELQARQEAGLWSVAEPPAEQEPEFEPFSEGARGDNPRAEERRAAPVRKAWDPASGLMFELGEPEWSLGERVDAFWSSFMAIAAASLGSGASPRIAAAALARGFHGWMGEMAFEMTDLPRLRVGFLCAFWARRMPEQFEALERARERCLDLGWATRVADTLDFRVGFLFADNERFDMLGSIARSMPVGEPRAWDLAFYREAAARVPEIFANLSASERAVRLALRARGATPGPLLIEAALDSCPRLLELWAPLGVPAQWGARSDWLGRALDAGVDPSALAGWVAAEPIERLASRMGDLPRRLARALLPMAEARLDAQGVWKFAGSWASARARKLGRAQRRWERLRGELKAHGAAALGVALGVGGLGAVESAWRSAIFGAPSRMRGALAKAESAGLPDWSELDLDGPLPLSVALGMRCFFEHGAPMDFLERLATLDRASGEPQAGRRDVEGRSASQWWEMALARRAGAPL